MDSLDSQEVSLGSQKVSLDDQADYPNKKKDTQSK